MKAINLNPYKTENKCLRVSNGMHVRLNVLMAVIVWHNTCHWNYYRNVFAKATLPVPFNMKYMQSTLLSLHS